MRTDRFTDTHIVLPLHSKVTKPWLKK